MGVTASTLLHVACGGGTLLLAAWPVSRYPPQLGFSDHLVTDVHTSELDNDDMVEWSPKERATYQALVDSIAQRMGIEKPIELANICSTNTPLMMQAQGMNWGIGRIGIAMTRRAPRRLSVAQLEFVFAHELAHIRSNDVPVMYGVPGFVGSLVTTAIMQLFPHSTSTLTVSWTTLVRIWIGVSSPASCVGLSMAMLTFCLLSRKREYAADAAAFIACSPDGKNGAFSLFQQFLVHNQQLRTSQPTWTNRLRFDVQGNNRWDVVHPSLASRMAVLYVLHTKDELKMNNTTINTNIRETECLNDTMTTARQNLRAESKCSQQNFTTNRSQNFTPQ